MPRKEVVSLEEAYAIAAQVCPSIMEKLGVPTNKMSAEDIVGEFITKFIEKGFITKFNPQVTSFRYYVYMGVRNAAVTMIRHLKYETTSLESITHSDPEFRPREFPAPEPVQDMILHGLLDEIWDFNFGYGRRVKVRGQEDDLIADLPSTARSVLQMLFMGYTKPEIAELFGVTVSTVNNVLSSVRDQVRERKLSMKDGRAPVRHF